MMRDVPHKVYVVATQTDELGPIIALAQRNDHGAYEQLYSRFVDQLYRYLYVRCSDAELAEEALGELWLRVVQHLPHFEFRPKGQTRRSRVGSTGSREIFRSMQRAVSASTSMAFLK